MARDIYLCKDGSFTEDPDSCPGGVEDSLPGHMRERLSRMLSGILRHFPSDYGVSVDERGWAGIGEIVGSLRRLRSYSWVEEWHLRAIASLDPKGRFEVSGGKIRARYGHSIRVKVEPLSYEAPRTLYHGTSRDRLPSILERGIVRMKRLKVHLTENLGQALEVGRRHGDPVAVSIDTGCLERKGLRAEQASKTVYTVDYVPPDCIREVVPGERTSASGKSRRS